MRLDRPSGVTLVEMMVAVAILAILAAVAWPSFQANLTRSRLQGAAEVLAQDLQLARSQSMKESCAVSVILTPGSSWSYELRKYFNPTTDYCLNTCTSTACSLKTVSSADYKNISLSLQSLPANSAITYDPVRSTSDSGSIVLTASTGDSLKVQVNAVGRVAICASTGSGGYPQCL